VVDATVAAITAEAAAAMTAEAVAAITAVTAVAVEAVATMTAVAEALSEAAINVRSLNEGGSGSLANQLALFKTNDGCLCSSTWDGLSAAEAGDTSVGGAAGKAGRDEVAAEGLESVASAVEVRVDSTETTVAAEAAETSLDAVSAEAAADSAATDVESAVEASSGLLLSETTETAKVLVGADITKAAETVVDTGTTVESGEAWPVSNVGLDATKAGETRSATEIAKIAEIVPLLVDFTASVDATDLAHVVERVGTTSVSANSTEASTDDGSASATEEATASVIDDAI
jgi:hypothetical protein